MRRDLLISFCFTKVLLKNQLLNHSLAKKLLSELPFFNFFLKEPSIKKHSKAFKNCARSYTVEVLKSKDLTSQPNIKNLLEDLRRK